MTLKDVEETTGIPATYLVESLKIPKSTPAEEPLGSLKRKYGFTKSKVREIIKEYRSNK